MAARGVPTGRTSHGLQGGLSGRPAARRSPTMAGTPCASERTRFEDLSGKHSHTLRLLPVYRQLGAPLTRHLVRVRLRPAAPFAAPARDTPRARQWRRLRRLWGANNSAHSAPASKTRVCMLFWPLRAYYAHQKPLGRRPIAPGPLAPLAASSQRCWWRRSCPLRARTHRNIATFDHYDESFDRRKG